MSNLLAHSPLGPSSSERWLKCPGSVAATAALPNTSSRYAAEGTAAHMLSEWCREQNHFAKFYRGRPIVVEGYEFEVDQEMIDGVQEFVDYCNDVAGDAYYEVRTSYEEWVPGGFGTSDDVRIRDGYCCVTDLKYGKGIQVFAKDNTQLMLYALGTYAEFRHLYDFREFELRICQPRLNHKDTWSISLEDLLGWAETVIRPGAIETKKANARFAAGDHCTFCKIKSTCAPRAKWSMQKVTASEESDFADLDEVLEAPIPKAAELTTEAVADCLSVLDAVTAWAKDIKSHAVRELQQGRVVGDWKLVAGRSRRYYTEKDIEVAAWLEEEGLSEEQIYTRKLITPPKLEKIIGKKHVIMTDPDKGGLVRKGPGKPKLAPGSDPRPAMDLDALNEFSDLDKDESEDDE